MDTSKRTGFTLIELMMVVIIISILATIVIVRIVQRLPDVYTKKAIVDIAAISTGLKMYVLDNGVFPSTAQGLKALIEKPSSTTASNWKGPYLETEPIDPWGNQYQYRCPSQGNHPDFDLWSIGPDSKDGTDDDVTNWKKDK